LRDRIIEIRAIAVLSDQDVLSFEYGERRRANVYEWDPQYGAWVGASDDIGTEYDDAGGVAGVSRDRDEVEGDFDFRPVPPTGASWVDLTFRPYEVANVADQSHFKLRIPLPVAKLTNEEWARLRRKYRLKGAADAPSVADIREAQIGDLVPYERLLKVKRRMQ
jgi:hypothetical protein